MNGFCSKSVYDRFGAKKTIKMKSGWQQHLFKADKVGSSTLL